MGRLLSSRLSLPFYDTDSYFECKYHLSIPDFFLKYGEDNFRICENSVLRELLSFPPCVLATGGGTPCFFDSMSLINEEAISLYIKMSAKSLFDRISHSKKVRPLMLEKSQEDLLAYVERLLGEREPFYEKAQFWVKGENLQVSSVLELLQPIL